MTMKTVVKDKMNAAVASAVDVVGEEHTAAAIAADAQRAFAVQWTKSAMEWKGCYYCFRCGYRYYQKGPDQLNHERSIPKKKRQSLLYPD